MAISDILKWFIGAVSALAVYAFTRDRDEIRRRLDVLEAVDSKHAAQLQAMAVDRATDRANHVALEARLSEMTDAISGFTLSINAVNTQLATALAELKLMQRE